MKFKINEVDMSSKTYYIPMVKRFWFSPWRTIITLTKGGFKLRRPSKVYLTSADAITKEDAQKIIDDFNDEIIYGKPYIKVIEYDNGRITYCPMIDKNCYTYSIYESSVKPGRYHLDNKNDNEYNSQIEARNIITKYIKQEKNRTVVSTSKSPYR